MPDEQNLNDEPYPDNVQPDQHSSSDERSQYQPASGAPSDSTFGSEQHSQGNPYGAAPQYQGASQPPRYPGSSQYPTHPGGFDPSGVHQVQVSLTPGNGLGVTSLVLGILALLGAFIPFINYVSGFLAVIGLVLGAVALARKGRSKGTAIGGLVVSTIALILSVILAFSYTAGFFSAVDDSLPKTEVKESSTEELPPADTEATVDEPEEVVLGTRENPAAIGTPIQLTAAGAVQYDVTLGSVVLNANDLVAAANPYNDDPPAGFQYALVPVTVVYQGTETGTPWVDVSVEFVSAAGTTHTSHDVSVVDPEPTLMDINELYPGASGTGNIVIAIPTADAESGTWVVSAGLFSSDDFFFLAQ